MQNFFAGWYLIYTKPRHEKKVQTQLLENDIPSFLPTKKAIRVWHDRKKYVEEPLFPSYIFIYLQGMDHYYQGIDSEGALYYVKNGNTPARVSESIISNIKLAATQSKDIEVSDSPFAAGTKLVISQGPLTGLSCEVVQHKKMKMLLVRVDLLKRSLLLSVPADHLITT